MEGMGVMGMDVMGMDVMGMDVMGIMGMELGAVFIHFSNFFYILGLSTLPCLPWDPKI